MRLGPLACSKSGITEGSKEIAGEHREDPTNTPKPQEVTPINPSKAASYIPVSSKEILSEPGTGF